MSGHSKWSTIKRKKEKTDSQRAKIFTKIGRELIVAVRESGSNPSINGKLRDIIAKAHANNVPNENIERLIKKANGDLDGQNFENIIYEGYGPAGIAVMVETLTDNRNRTAADMRHIFDKYGGNLGQSGCVQFLFSHQGVILLDANHVDAETLIEISLEANADDISQEEDYFDIRTSPSAFHDVREALETKKFQILSFDLEYIPLTSISLQNPNDIKLMAKMLERFEENDDVQAVWHNWENQE